MSALKVLNEPLRPFFTAKTLAQYLSVSERTARQLIGDGTIPSHKVAGARRVDPSDLDAYLADRRFSGSKR